MILAVDVHYKETYAKVVGILFNWDDIQPQNTFITKINDVAPYQSGEFYKRELPCVMEILNQINLAEIECIIVDGFVFVDNNKKFGLGGHLWEAIDKKTPIVGVAKRSFHETEKVSNPIFRGESKQPLFVSSIGVDIDYAIKNIQDMKGEYRIPAVLKILDQITKED